MNSTDLSPLLIEINKSIIPKIKTLKPETGGLFFKNKEVIIEAFIKEIKKQFIKDIEFENGRKLNLKEKNKCERIVDKIYNNGYEKQFLESFARNLFVSKGMYALITADFLDALASVLEGERVLEIMSGRGYLSKGLKDRGVLIKASDDRSWHNKLNWERCYIETENLDAIKSVEKYGREADVIIMSWCPYQSTMDYSVLEMMRKVNPNCILLVIGEGYGGCTGSDIFHQNMKQVYNNVSDRLNDVFEQWSGVNDRVYIVK